MEFRLLGPVEVLDDRGPVPVGGPKPRAVLAVLLLHANRPVSAERLAIALWGDEAPAGAAKTVQVHVSRLRKALAVEGILTNTRAGYCLRVGPGELDVERFEQVASDGRRLLDGGDPSAAAQRLREALSLWRGPPLADLAFEPFAGVEVARLEEQRLAALEARIDADLAAGRHTELVGELQQLTAAHPTRERIAGQLMLALYRCGRQAEALAQYRSAHAALVAAAGVEPGVELRTLHDDILRQAASLDPAPPPRASLAPELEAAASTPLVGRVAELGWLRERWTDACVGEGAVVAVRGARGMGKTRLLAELARDVHGAGAEVLYASLIADPRAAAECIAHAARAPRPTLIVLDDADALQRGPPLPSVAGRAVLVAALVGEGPASSQAFAGATLRLLPIDREAVGEIARSVIPRALAGELPVESISEASRGVPARVYELADEWARREAARRVEQAAAQAAGGRARIRAIEHRLASNVVDLRDMSQRRRGASEQRDPVVCPFKGLAPYEPSDAAFFGGRDGLVAELVTHVVGAPLLGIVGPSGSGKSSLLRAGLLPALGEGVLPGSQAWEQLLMRPGARPLGALDRLLSDREDGARAVVAIDQFEEAFTVCSDEGERSAFLARLVDIAEGAGDRHVVVMVVRADFYGRCADDARLARLLTANTVLVPPMGHDELVDAIERPARRARLDLEPGLTTSLIDDVHGAPGTLPLLSTALLALWERREGRRLTREAYARTGGVRGAVAGLGEQAYGLLGQGQQRVAQSLLLRLTDEGVAGRPERRAVALGELTQGDDDMAEVIERLADGRVLTLSSDTAELAHEALLDDWPRLREWIEENRAGLRIQRRLTAAATEWSRLDEDDGALYRGGRLLEALEWRDRQKPALSPLEERFLATAEARRAAELAGRRRRIRSAFVALGVALGAITLVAVLALRASREAHRQRDIARSGELAASSVAQLGADPGESLALARQAVETAPTAQAATALRQAVLDFRALGVIRVGAGRVYSVNLSPDGRRLAGGSQNGDVTIWDASTGRALLRARPRRAATYAARFSPDGRRVASGGADGTVTLTSAAGGPQRVVLRDRGQQATSVAFAPAGTALVAGFTDGTVRLARLGGPQPARVLSGHTDVVAAVAFSPDGQRFASASFDGTVRVWSAAGDAPPLVLRGARGGMGGIGFSPDGREVAGGGADGRIYLWNAASGRQEGRISAGRGAIFSLCFTPDGRRIVTGGEDGVVRVVDAAARAVAARLRGHAGQVFDVGVDRRGDRVVSAGEDGTIRTWDPGTTWLFRGADNTAALDARGGRIAAGTTGGPVRIWQAATGALEHVLLGQRNISRPSLSRDGRRVVSASFDGTVRVWAAPAWDTEAVFRDVGRQARAAEFDPAGRRVVSGGSSGAVVIRDLHDGRRVELTGRGSQVTDVRFSPDGRRVAGAFADGSVRIWDLGRRAAPGVLRGHRGPVNSVAFSADGRRIVSAGADGTVRVWTPGDGRMVVLRGHDGEVESAEFNRAGDRVVSAGADGTVRIWDPRGGGSLVTIQRHAGPARSASFTPDGAAVLSSGDDGLAQLSACEVCGSLAQVSQLASARATQRPRPVAGP